MTSHLENRAAPTIWLKMVPKQAKTALFCFFGWDTAGFDVSCSFFLWDCSQYAERQTYVGFFENSSDRPSTMALFLGVRGQTR